MGGGSRFKPPIKTKVKVYVIKYKDFIDVYDLISILIAI